MTRPDTQSPAALLEQAATLVERALSKLNTDGEPCQSCGHMHFESMTERRTHDRLSEIPRKLRAAADDVLNARRGHATRVRFTPVK